MKREAKLKPFSYLNRIRGELSRTRRIGQEPRQRADHVVALTHLGDAKGMEESSTIAGEVIGETRQTYSCRIEYRSLSQTAKALIKSERSEASREKPSGMAGKSNSLATVLLSETTQTLNSCTDKANLRNDEAERQTN